MSDTNLDETLKKLKEIVDWFDSRQDLEVEEALTKLKEGRALIDEAGGRLKEVENEFTEIEKSFSDKPQLEEDEPPDENPF